ncbi:MAG: hypothetical protein VX354_00210 [Pseudomonadota bacterium]
MLVSDTGILSIITLLVILMTFMSIIFILNNCESRQEKISFYLLAYIVLIYFFREADLHRLLTEEHITRFKYYTDASIDIKERFLYGSILIIFMLSSCLIFYRYAKFYFLSLKEMQTWSVSLFLFFILLLISQIADKSFLNDTVSGRILEELMEFSAAIYAFLATYYGGLVIKNKNG